MLNGVNGTSRQVNGTSQKINGAYKIINGLQHIGIGVEDIDKSWKWYRKYFGLDIPFFDAIAEAPLMQYYNGGSVIEKRAVMVMNLQGGGAVEMVQPTSFKNTTPNFEVRLGDLGIFITKVKTRDINLSFQLFKKDGVEVSAIQSTPDGKLSFLVKDINGLYFQVIEGGNDWYTKTKHVSGGIAGAIVGVSDMDRSIKYYQEMIGFGNIVYDEVGVFEDMNGAVPGGDGKIRRVLLEQPGGSLGNFGEMMGKMSIELVQALDRTPVKIFRGRQWGDVGFVHLALDVKGMYGIEKDFNEYGYPFTCDSQNVLSMGKSQVHCVYVEDPDNTLIELIEVYKFPLVEKWGLFMDVQKRHPKKPVPSWMLKLMRFSRVKDN